MLYHMATFPMTLSDPNRGFKVTGYLQVEYLKNGAFWDKVTKEQLLETIHDLPNGATFNDLE